MLKRKEKEFEKNMDILPVGVFFADISGKITYFNKKALSISQEQEKIFSEMYWFDIVSIEDKNKAVTLWNNLITNNIEINTELNLENKKTVILTLVREDKGNNKFIGTMQEITLQKQREEQLKQDKIAAENADKAKSHFLANMSHEIRTPMNGIFGMLQLFQMTNISKEQYEYFDLLKISVENLLKIIDDILDISKIEAGKIDLEYKRFNIKKVLEEATDVFKLSAYRKEILILSKIEENIPQELYGDALRIRQILINLIGNAVKFTEKGKIEINIKKIDENNEFTKICFEVKDTGIGIPKEKLKLVFESFEQGDISVAKKIQGVGLGLTIAKKLVEIMGGNIEVESEYKEGSIFRFYISFEKGEVKTEHKKVEEQNNPVVIAGLDENLKGNVLLVDDNEINRKVTAAFLEMIGFVVKEAEDGFKAIELFEKELFDYIFLDIQMPEMSGYEVTKKIRGKTDATRNTPIIALTALAMKEDREKCLAEGMDEYIAKPIRLEEVIRSINKIKNTKSL